MSGPVLMLFGGEAANHYADPSFQSNLVQPLAAAVTPQSLRWGHIFHTDIRANDGLLDKLTVQGVMPSWSFLGILFIEGSDSLVMNLTGMLEYCPYPYETMELRQFKITNQFGMRRECTVDYFMPFHSLMRNDT